MLATLGVMAVALASIAVFLAVRDAGDDDAQATLRVTAPVERRTLIDEVVTRGVLGFPTRGRLLAGGSGRVTSVGVAPGDVVEAGTTILTLDGRPGVAVRGESPFWRVLRRGMAGPDVAQLQRLLGDAGFPTDDPSGRFGAATQRALTQWQTANDHPASDGVLGVDDMLVGDWPQRVGAVHVDLGGIVAPGAELVTLTADTPMVSVELLPSDRLRVTVGDPATIEVSASGATVTGRLSAVSDAPVTTDDESIVYPGEIAVDEDLGVSEGAQARVSIEVRKADDVLAVPVAAVISDEQGEPAVRVVDADRTITTTPVELGVSQGAYVEVTSGLDGSETVVVVEEADR